MELDALGSRTLGVFEAILQARHRYGPDAIGYYVVSGTQGADDVLAPLLLARWAEAYDRVSRRSGRGHRAACSSPWIRWSIAAKSCAPC